VEIAFFVVVFSVDVYLKNRVSNGFKKLYRI